MHALLGADGAVRTLFARPQDLPGLVEVAGDDPRVVAFLNRGHRSAVSSTALRAASAARDSLHLALVGNRGREALLRHVASLPAGDELTWIARDHGLLAPEMQRDAATRVRGALDAERAHARLETALASAGDVEAEPHVARFWEDLLVVARQCGVAAPHRPL